MFCFYFVRFFLNLCIFLIGIVFKKLGGWRLIIYLFVLEGNSINDFIDFKYCLVKYFFFDEVVIFV